MPPAPFALARCLRILAATLGWFGLWCAGAVLTSGRPQARRRVRGFAFARWGAGLLRTARVELQIVGVPPRAPFLLVANHTSYLDVPVLAALGNGCFVAKAEIARWPVIGPLARGMGTVFVERGARRAVLQASGEIEQRLAKGYGVFLFPEGGIPSEPELGEFRGSLLESALRAAVPVHCAAIRYSAGDAEWRRGEPLLGHFLRLLASDATRVVVAFGEARPSSADRKAVARELRERVRELLETAAAESSATPSSAAN